MALFDRIAPQRGTWKLAASLALAFGLSLTAPAAASGPAADALARGDAAWDRRAEGERDGLPAPGPIRDALAAYESAIAADPQSVEAHWKLLRALHFAGDFQKPPAERRAEIFERGRLVALGGIDALAARLGIGAEALEALDPPEVVARLAPGKATRDAGRFYFWGAVNWGSWSRTVGLLSAVQQGVAPRLYRYTTLSIALEPDYEEGGGYRLLGRLHAELPRVPFLTGWVDRDLALPLVERAHRLAPESPGNRLLLALTLLDLAPEREGEARELLSEVESLTPRASMRVEDLTLRRMARERIEEDGPA